MGQRADRVGHLLQRELSEQVRVLKDPRVQAATLITITAVRVADDLGMARVMVSIIDDKPKEVLRAIGNAQRFLHGQLARALQMKKIPELRFMLDVTEEKAGNIDALLREVRAQPPVGPSSNLPPVPEDPPAHPDRSADDHLAPQGANGDADDDEGPGRGDA